MARSKQQWSPSGSPFRLAGLSGEVQQLAVVFGDQLDRRARLLRKLDKKRDAVLMMEVVAESEVVANHAQRSILFLSAMRHFALQLSERGYRVRYVRLDDPANTQSLDGEFQRAVKALNPQSIAATHPGAWRILELLRRWAKQFDLPLEVVQDEHFYTTPAEFGTWADGRRELVMEYFYREQRRKQDILMTPQGGPEGDQWNFDRDNRQALDEAPSLPRPYTPRNDAVTQEVLGVVVEHLPRAAGSAEDFRWPVTRDQARRALRDFIEHRLPLFGPYQDAMWTGEDLLYHSALSSSLNLKLLDPRECVDLAVEAYRSGQAPLNSVEGFVRQLVGWREFIRGVYWYEGAGYERRNELSAQGRLPDFYWSGITDMNCMKHCLSQVLKTAYGHHIQRLMVTGNFALIAGVAPQAVSDWYLGMYVDAVEWVTLPNTVGMVMHADGGVVGTKPYAASGRYIQRMSNYCQACPYDVSQRAGDDACPFNTFYWDFLIRHRRRFSSNRRMGMMLKNLQRLSDGERRQITQHAGVLRRQMGID